MCFCLSQWFLTVLLGVSLNHHGMTLENRQEKKKLYYKIATMLILIQYITLRSIHFNLSVTTNLITLGILNLTVCYLSSSSTGCYESILSSLLLQSVCYCGCQSAASGTEWVTQRQRTAPQIELLHGRSPNLHTQRASGHEWRKHQ